MLIIKNGITKDVSQDAFEAQFKSLGFREVREKKDKKKKDRPADEPEAQEDNEDVGGDEA